MYRPDAVVNSRKPLKDTQTNRFPWISRWKMEDGAFDLKFLSHSDKCPDGSRLYTVHQFEMEAGDKYEKWQRFLCTESTKGFNEDTNRLLKPCFACDMCEDIRQMGDWYEKELEPEFQKIILNLSAPKCRSFLFPVLIYARMVTEEGTNKKGEPVKKTKWFPDKKNLTGGILELNVGSDRGDKELYQAIFDLHEREGDQLFDPAGVWCTYTKGKQQRLISTRPRRLSDDEEKLYKSYPDVMSYGKAIEAGAFQKPSLDIPYSKQRALISKSWWGKALAEDHDYDFDDPNINGIACRPAPDDEEDNEWAE